jgi:hypothetical protein
MRKILVPIQRECDVHHTPKNLIFHRLLAASADREGLNDVRRSVTAMAEPVVVVVFAFVAILRRWWLNSDAQR